MSLDQLLLTGAPEHYDPLILLRNNRFPCGRLAFPMLKNLMKVAGVRSALRILIPVGDVMLGPMF